jgi:hypothetical protein
MIIDRTAFFAATRKSLFGGVLTQSQVDGIRHPQRGTGHALDRASRLQPRHSFP